MDSRVSLTKKKTSENERKATIDGVTSHRITDISGSQVKKNLFSDTQTESTEECSMLSPSYGKGCRM